MSFKMKYEITKDYLTKKSMKRPGNVINPTFTVAHDTGNPGSTAKGNVSYYKRVENQDYASAHLFVDDKDIIECIPALTGAPERAYQVIYDVTTDNKMFGDDANDAAIGVEFCFGGKINGAESYKRYVWVLAYICYKYGMNPSKSVVGHKILDPGRKIDPHNGLSKIGKTYEQLLSDVVKEYNECASDKAEVKAPVLKVTTDTYVVKAGDSFWKIANQHGLDVDKLQALNPGIKATSLQIGTKLKLKATATAPKATPAAKPVTKATAKTPIRPYPGKPLTIGSKGNDVKAVQRAMGFKEKDVNGVYEKSTATAVKAYQKRKGLVADGITGPATWNMMF